MRVRRKRLLIVVVGVCLLAVVGLAFGLRQLIFTGDNNAVSPWLYCTTNPCQPLALFALPTPPALTHDVALAAKCDDGKLGADDGILLWHTDWDPRTEEGRCASSDEAGMLGAK